VRRAHIQIPQNGLGDGHGLPQLGFALGERYDAQLAYSALVMAVALSGSTDKQAQPIKVSTLSGEPERPITRAGLS